MRMAKKKANTVFDKVIVGREFFDVMITYLAETHLWNEGAQWYKSEWYKNRNSVRKWNMERMFPLFFDVL